MTAECLRCAPCYGAAFAADRRAIETLGKALAGAERPLVAAFGTMAMKPGQLATEDDAYDPSSVGGPRSGSEEAMRALAALGVRAPVIRLPPVVHGDGDRAGFAPRLIQIARKKRASAYLGDGLNRWPAVHRLDAARLFRLALEKGEAGSRYHAVAEEGVPFRTMAEVCEIDRCAIEALGGALAGSDRPLIVTSGTALLSPGELATEETAPHSGPVAFPRVSEQTVPILIGIARDKGVSAYVGDGVNRWPAVHRLDSADLYRRVLEKGSAGGRYHAIADEGVPFLDIAKVIGLHLNVPVVSKSTEEAANHFGWFARFTAMAVRPRARKHRNSWVGSQSSPG